MKKRFLAIFSFLLAATVIMLGACVNGEDPKNENVKVLFIGNSFTYYSDVPALFEKIAESAGKTVRVESVTKGSWNLTKFADENDEYGSVVDEKLKAYSDYSAVVLQEQSARPLNNYSAFLKGARDLKDKIDSTQKNCRVYLYSTWGYAEEAEKRGMTVTQMEEKIFAAYQKVAKELGVEVSPAGRAFSAVFEAYPDINLYYTDGKHPSYAGAYLAACVHVATVLRVDPRGALFNGELDRQTAVILKAEAYRTVYGT